MEDDEVSTGVEEKRQVCGGKGEARLRPLVMETAQAPGNEAELAAPVRGEVL